jgi:hypothetical protein
MEHCQSFWAGGGIESRLPAFTANWAKSRNTKVIKSTRRITKVFFVFLCAFALFVVQSFILPFDARLRARRFLDSPTGRGIIYI